MILGAYRNDSLCEVLCRTQGHVLRIKECLSSLCLAICLGEINLRKSVAHDLYRGAHVMRERDERESEKVHGAERA